MVTDIAFPTLGELVSFIYDATGVLTSKHADDIGLTDTDIRTINRKLERLADEEGNINAALGESLRTLAGIVAGTIPDLRVVSAIGDVVLGVLDCYRDNLREEGTYLNKSGTVRYLIAAHAAELVTAVVTMTVQRYNIGALKYITPDCPDWYLPSISGNSIESPLEKTLRWAYKVCDTTQTHFHYPGRSSLTDDIVARRNYDSATKWLQGTVIPTWSVLYWNIKTSFEKMAACKAPEHRRTIDGKVQDSIITALFIARTSSYISREIVTHYGIDFLDRLVKQCRQYSHWIRQDSAAINNKVTSVLTASVYAEAISDQVWRRESDAYWRNHYERTVVCERVLMRHIQERNDGADLTDLVPPLVERFGPLVVHSLINRLSATRRDEMPNQFPQLLLTGLELRKNHKINVELIDQYTTELRSFGVERYVPWMEPWLRGVLCYRESDYSAAFKHIEEAFELSKYCAGGNLYKLVNLYVELAAKMDSWMSFKKGVQWADYLGFEIRHIRHANASEESMRSAFALFQTVRYGDL
ncbi:hypothetical protein [Noviherbaspirillum malthae]|uniref:hypothetical protein n=1 Tax=Noviherbaspirillum malthae TaxID=1260987 RepID=UPI00188F236F|nr:hypothetical protein [Noviherbaspirillum malthae]